MYLLAELQEQCRRSLYLYPVSEPRFSSFYKSIIIAVTFSLEKPLARSICFVFRLCMESNALGKSVML